MTTSYSYDDANAVTAIVHAKGTQVLDESRYTYDSAGRRTVVKQFDGDHRFGYDAAGRVTSADHPAGQTDEAFGYDLLGNRTGGGEQYDAANKLTSRNGFSYTYDDEGRTTSRTETATGEVTRFGWGQGGQLRSVTLPNGDVTRYRYDPLGRRIETAAPGRTRVQVYGVDPNAVAESTGAVDTRFTFGIGYDAPLAMQRAGVASFFAQDALSSVTSLTDNGGAVSGRYSYDSYGQITSTSRYTYTGREWDGDAGIYDYRARQYDPAIGRFLTEDPVDAANTYDYASGAPTLLTDPSGQIDTAETAGAMAVQQALIGANANLAIRLLRCGGGTPEQVAKTVGGGLLAGGIFGGAMAAITKAIVRRAIARRAAGVSESQAKWEAAFQVGMAGLVFGWFTSFPNHILGNLAPEVDDEDPLGWMITPLAQGVAGGLPIPGLVAAGVDLAVALGSQLVPWALSDDTKEDCAG